jgi:hypothetical protein
VSVIGDLHKQAIAAGTSWTPDENGLLATVSVRPILGGSGQPIGYEARGYNGTTQGTTSGSTSRSARTAGRERGWERELRLPLPFPEPVEWPGFTGRCGFLRMLIRFAPDAGTPSPGEAALHAQRARLYLRPVGAYRRSTEFAAAQPYCSRRPAR